MRLEAHHRTGVGIHPILHDARGGAHRLVPPPVRLHSGSAVVEDVRSEISVL